MKNIVLLLACLFLSACAHPVSEQSMKLVDKSITYSRLRENPDEYRGSYVLVGGIIASVRNTPQEGQLEVVQMPLDSSGMPKDTYNSEGRFIATANRFLDPLIFKQGRNVTMVGDVKGKVVQSLDQIQYTYPLIGIRELRVWSDEEVERKQYPPAYPYYWNDPWWPYWFYGPGPFRPW